MYVRVGTYKYSHSYFLYIQTKLYCIVIQMPNLSVWNRDTY